MPVNKGMISTEGARQQGHSWCLYKSPSAKADLGIFGPRRTWPRTHDKKGRRRFESKFDDALCHQSPLKVHNNVISGFKALRQARARTRDRMVPANLGTDSLATVPPTPPLLRTSKVESAYHYCARIFYSLLANN
ncbi:hypothetical protein PoB_000977400 [Plakobranchus ocellatus]|uniref:Uncharacterized protein n=1 Tax=Plakobranchus ocellatus TaxID=259542 RepID=A0AAV3YMC8_9GAST|nr:hypothetical protein PoB_000977400 [Plakobranchus ocellatus]